jgi:type I restriction enzyme R subunit
MASVHGEGAFESAIETHLLAHGWVKGTASFYHRDLGLDTSVLFEFIGATQLEQWERLVGLHGGASEAQHKFAKRLAAEIDARGTVDVLRRGVEDMGVKIRLAFFKPAHALTPDLFALYDANRLVVSRQVHHSESNPQDSLDLLMMINGLPVATAELKNQMTGQTVEHAKRQYRKDRNPRDLVFDRRTVVHFAVDQDLVFLTTRLEGDKTGFLPFNEGSGGPGREGGKGNPPTALGYRTAYLWEQVWQRDNWLDLLARFIHEEKPSGRGRKPVKRGEIIFPRFHQWDLVLRLAAHASTWGPGRNYLPQHSAGSGKSNSIAWLAHRLSTLHTPSDSTLLTEHATGLGLGANEKVFHKVVVVTDRVVLDRQLQDTIWQFDHTPGVVERIDKNSQQLADALEGSRAQIIITTLQKFPVIAKAAVDAKGKRFAVIVDEAHSSQSGESAKDLKSVLGADSRVTGSGDSVDGAIWDAAEKYDAAMEAGVEAQDALTDSLAALRASAATRGLQDNLSFFAFTATPKTKTLELFGERIPDSAQPSGFRLEPFHLYSMRQAIEERFILDVLAAYVTYSTYFRLANGLSSSDPEVYKGKANAALARFVALHPSNLAQKAEIIVEHFRAVTRHQIGGQAKAMVVTRSRLYAARYKQAIDDYLRKKGYDSGPHKIAAPVAFSGTMIDPTEPGPGVHRGTDERVRRGAAAETIRQRRLSRARRGGEVPDRVRPAAAAMYVDKKLAGVKAVQTLSRLNAPTRPRPTPSCSTSPTSQRKAGTRSSRFFGQSSAAPTDPNLLHILKHTIRGAQVIRPEEQAAAVAALLSDGSANQKIIYANLNPAVGRFDALDGERQENFRQALKSYVRSYSFLA